MFTSLGYEGTLQEKYDQLSRQLDALLEGEPNETANLANASALLNQFMERINWAGFYLMDGEDELVLGPFQGLPACVRIPLGKGVCGTAAKEQKTQLVDDVFAFPGHIACDAASRSEVVVPIVVQGRLIGVLDIDSPEKSRFTKEDAEGLEKFVGILAKHLGN
ncbi:GAF domain-containing protein [Bhargavaea ullalensis]|uniref:GAF domain-containing protein n=1 Tax=Bhargavaea ullalensis TaxID=1265685 RepID=A0ABV2GAR7_9BACL